MNLNTDIIYKELSQSFLLEYYGIRKKDMLLHRPMFWFGEEMEPNRVYVVRYDRFPQHTQTAEGDLIICVGGNPPVWNHASCTILVIKDADILTVFNLLQRVFERYDAWELRMQQIVEEGRDLQQLVECCDQILGAPFLIVDHEFHYLAISPYVYDDPRFTTIRSEKDLPNPRSISMYLEQYGTNNAVRRDIFMAENRGLIHLSKNIFDRDSLAGSMTVFLLPEQEQEPITKLAEIVFDYAEKLFRKTVMRSVGSAHILKTVLRDLVNCYPVDPFLIKKTRANIQDTYICAKLQLHARLQNISLDYCCAGLEETLPGSVAFAYENSVVTFLNITKMACTPEAAVSQIFSRLPYSEIQIGISNPFRDISNARSYFLEASVALKTGSAFHADKKFFSFNDYALHYILIKSAGEFKMEFLLQEYLGELLAHDINSPVSYMETLRSFIGNNMNLLKTSKELYLHRSTLSTRLDKIKQMIKLDWEQPDDRLLIFLLLKGKEITIGK